MKYWGPINSTGGINGNDGYVNGNPGTGTEGSIPTFQAFEQTLRELQNLVLVAGLAPSSVMNDTQVWQSILRCSTFVATGTGNAAVVTPPNSIAIPSAAVAQRTVVNVVWPATNTASAVTLNVGPGPVTVKDSDGNPVAIGDLQGGRLYTIWHDGTFWRTLGVIGQLKRLSAPTTFYVNPVTGSDANNGLTAGTAWATLNFAYSWLQRNLNFNGQTVTISCAFPNSPTTYAAFSPSGGISGVFSPSQLIILGDVTNKNCRINPVGAIGVAASIGALLTIQGFTIGSVLSGGLGGSGVVVTAGATVYINSCKFLTCNNYVMLAQGSGSTLNAASTNVEFTGSALNAYLAQDGATVDIQSSLQTLTGSIGFANGFCAATNTGQMSVGGACTFVGAQTGPRFLVQMNGILNTGGAQAALNTAYIPGASPGIQLTGGQFQ